MPSVSATDADSVLEINHHIVHLNTAQRHGSSEDFLGNIIIHSNDDSLHQHLGGYSTTPILPGHTPGGTGTQETDQESLIVVYALFLPLLAALVFILIVALYVRRMRRSTSAISTESGTEYENHGMEFGSSESISKPYHTMTTFSYPPRPKSVEPEFRSGSSKSFSSSSSSSSARTQHDNNERRNEELFDSSSITNNAIVPHTNKGLKNLGGKFVSIINIPKRIKAHSAEKHRFNIYTVPIETREQLKQIYVY